MRIFKWYAVAYVIHSHGSSQVKMLKGERQREREEKQFYHINNKASSTWPLNSNPSNRPAKRLCRHRFHPQNDSLPLLTSAPLQFVANRNNLKAISSNLPISVHFLSLNVNLDKWLAIGPSFTWEFNPKCYWLYELVNRKWDWSPILQSFTKWVTLLLSPISSRVV